MAQVDRAMLEVEQHMPPVKGLIQATIVMRDQPFAKVNLEDGWMTTILPKVQGTWNLHYRHAETSGLLHFTIVNRRIFR